MNITAHVSSFSSEEVELWRTYERARKTLEEQQRLVRAKVDALRLKARPTFPLPEHEAGIAKAIELYRAGEPGVLHGAPVGPPGEPTAVVYQHMKVKGWVQVRHGAPYQFENHSGRYLWTFTEEEELAIQKLVMKHGGQVISAWASDGGLSIWFDLPQEEVSKEEKDG